MKDFEKVLMKYMKARGWDTPHPGDLAKSISIESAELLEIFQWDNPSFEELLKNKEKTDHISKELADVMIYCFQFSMLMGFDTQKILNKKLALAKKKYPAKLMKKRTSAAGTEDLYWKIKKEHRMKGLS